MIDQEHQFYYSPSTSTVSQSVKVPVKCPDTNCRGVLNNDMVCCICQASLCPRCEVLKEDDLHVCKEETLASIQFIRENCKSCPKCNARISMIEGCNQMFCTSCKTAFHWSSLSLIPSGSYFHNPHFTEFQLENGGNDVHTFRQLEKLDDEVNFRDVEQRFYEEKPNSDAKELKFAKGFLLVANELKDTWSHTVEETEQDFRHLRVLYFLNEITDDFFKKTLLKADKLRDRRIALQKTFLWYANSVKEFFSIWVKRTITFVELVDKINETYNESRLKLNKVRKIFGGPLIKFSHNHFNLNLVK